jgi:DivIVA domain-containing protein
MSYDNPDSYTTGLEQFLAKRRSAGDPGVDEGSTVTFFTPEQVHDVAFSKAATGKRGYNVDEVDEFLELIEKKLRSPTEWGLTADDVEHVSFSPSKGRRGYDEDQIDAFLDVIVAQLKSQQGTSTPPR